MWCCRNIKDLLGISLFKYFKYIFSIYIVFCVRWFLMLIFFKRIDELLCKLSCYGLMNIFSRGNVKIKRRLYEREDLVYVCMNLLCMYIDI